MKTLYENFKSYFDNYTIQGIAYYAEEEAGHYLWDMTKEGKIDRSSELIEMFAKEYFIMRGEILSKNLEMADMINSDEFRDWKFLVKLRYKRESKKWRKLAENTDFFENEFYEKTNINLIDVENERYAKENNIPLAPSL